LDFGFWILDFGFWGRLRRRRTLMKGFEMDLKGLLAPMVAGASEIVCRIL